MNETQFSDAAVIALEGRPTGDFIDGYLAGLATANAALSGAPANSFFYSFDWIGDASEPVEASLHGAFQSKPEMMAFEVSPLADWRAEALELARRWLGRHLPPPAGEAVADEFVEIMTAFIADGRADVFTIRPTAPAGRADFEPRIGASFDHIMFETVDGRLLLEFSHDA
ncbi:MAG: hypothetical protein MRY74_14995 [Neomegalonema sp.]|nr:hypothetical protein [Neomegalonema sp.]